MKNDHINSLKNDHKDFEKGSINELLSENPFIFFQKWFDEAIENKVTEVNAMSISTVNEDLQPSSRMVYLKELKNERFIFFTNYGSQKGQNLAHNPKIACLFYWKELERQIRIEGTVTKSSIVDSEEYFHSRPKSSQIGAWASKQSKVLTSRNELEDRVNYFTEKFTNEVPLPDFWGGYEIEPTLIEFWQGRQSRLHDRIIFQKDKDNNWKNFRKHP